MKRKKLLNLYIDLPIRFKILIWFIPLLLITIVITGGYSYYTAKKQVLEKINLSQLEFTNQISNQLDYISGDAIDFTNYLFLLSSVQQFLNPIPEEDSISRHQQINELVSRLLVNQRNIQSLVLYSFNEEVPPLAVNQTGITSAMPFNKFKETTHYQLAVEQQGKPSWTLLKGKENVFEGDRRNKIIITKVIKNSYTLKDIGMIIIGISEQTLRNKFTNGLNNDAQLFIVNKNSQVVTSTDDNWIGKTIDDTPYFKVYSDRTIELKNDQLLFAKSSSEYGWDVLLVQPRNELLKELDKIKVLTLLVTAFCFVVGVWISWFISSIITKPLKKLTKSMLMVKIGDFNQKVNLHGKDEVGELGNVYDLMVQQIKKLINDVYHSQLRQKEAELKFLQAQIHPHFLYNTLDTIFWMAQKKNETAIANMIHSLSQFFRLSLSDGKDFVPIKNELLLVENYLTLQKKRFTNKFSYEINASDDVKDFLIPKLLIQPLIENALIHGIELLEDNGFIYIHIFQEKDQLLINVVDNGCGIETDKLKKINSYLQSNQLKESTLSSNNRPGYALLNIMERLKITFGNQANMTIESEYGLGTKIKMTLPLSSINKI
ncbi:sensor histidine kinase [Neobacillus novalis]|uniref:Sensor histidine kinase n=1 Tax=Neobacillus novalis TaxID=220687 RepID=A0AA95SAQ6_9BACI|nr:sensor histidine kinase [Neobacillus novalis]WHY85679.1 sensor histidine kinase [Neobacillus novalis]